MLLFAVAAATTMGSAFGVAAPAVASANGLRTPGAANVSTNWAGYAATGQDARTTVTFTDVTGTWTEPTVLCSAATAGSVSVSWVGLGGYDLHANALEQVGTEADCGEGGLPSYRAWYEIVPSAPIALPLTVAPGDVVTGSVSVVRGGLVLQLRNRTRHAVVTEVVSLAGADLSSAEWVAEAPSRCVGLACVPLPLADFGTIGFSRIAAIGDGHSGTLIDPLWAAVPLQLVPFDSGGVTSGTAPPSALSPNGRAFNLTWVADATASLPSAASSI